MRYVIAFIVLAFAVAFHDLWSQPTAAPADTPQCWTVHDGLNHPCSSHGRLREPVEWRITDKQGLDHACWRLAMTLAHPGPDDPDETNFTDCNDQTTYDRYRIGDSYWAPDSMTQLAG